MVASFAMKITAGFESPMLQTIILTKEQIFEILESKETALKLSEKYGVHRTTINSVRRGATYKNLGQR